MAIYQATAKDALAIAAMAAAMAFVAAMILSASDQARWDADRSQIRQRLASRADRNDNEFLAAIQPSDHELAIQVRRRLAEFFEVSPLKIRAEDELARLSFERFMPGIYVFVIGGILTDQAPGKPGTVERFPKTRLTRVSDLIIEVKSLGTTR
jgi:hypothetical protein